jgi:hypothetical protein
MDLTSTLEQKETLSELFPMLDKELIWVHILAGTRPS